MDSLLNQQVRNFHVLKTLENANIEVQNQYAFGMQSDIRYKSYCKC